MDVYSVSIHATNPDLLYLSAPLELSTHPTPSPPACTPRPPLPCGHGVPSHRHIAREPHDSNCGTCTNGCACPHAISFALLYLSAPLDWPTHPTPSPPACTPRPPFPWPWHTITPPYRTRTAIRTADHTHEWTYIPHAISFALLYLSAPLDLLTHPTPYPSAGTPRPPIPW